jgi:hypothetical protein
MSDSTAPTEWSFRNGAFIGFCMVQPEPSSVGGFKSQAQRQEADWLFFSQDMRQITAIRQHSPEHPEWSDIYSGPNHIATINVHATDLSAKWETLLHAFERIPSTAEARTGRLYAMIDHEAMPADRPRT